MSTRKRKGDGSRASREVEDDVKRLRRRSGAHKWIVRRGALIRKAAEDRIVQELGEVAFPDKIPFKKIRAEAKRRMREYRNLVEKKLAARHKGIHITSGDFLDELRKRIVRRNPDKRMPTRPPALVPFLSYFDWRLAGIVPPVRDQADCNACWAFAATSVFESCLTKNRNKYKTRVGWERIRVTQFVLSVQSVLDCVSDGNCAGGWHGAALNHFVENGVPIRRISTKRFAIDDSRDFIGKKRRCRKNEKTGIKAVAWDFVNLQPDKIPSVQRMKEALLEHGPLVVLVTKDDALQAYKRGVFKGKNQASVNHAFLLTGWDDKKKAWIAQNSFGEDWGASCITKESLKISPVFGALLKEHKGCMYIAWGSNNVGKFAAWVEAPFDLGTPSQGHHRNIRKSGFS